MKQSIQLKLGQHLTMTPQLQQAIRLLQLSTLELQLEVQTVLDSNLMLERDENDVETKADTETSSESAPDQAAATDTTTEKSEGPDAEISSNTETMPDELPGDTNWEDTYDMGATSLSTPSGDNDRDFFETHVGSSETLHEHLYWQLDLTPFSDIDRAIAEAIIDSINDDGYLNISLEDLCEGLGLAPELEVGVEEIQAVLRRIQHFDPVGVGARDPAECLLIQLLALEPDTKWRKQALQLVQEHVTLLGNARR
jgi:RNA polymerase sigma-54 factor